MWKHSDILFKKHTPGPYKDSDLVGFWWSLGVYILIKHQDNSEVDFLRNKF